MSAMEVRSLNLHGRPVTYAVAGEGPVLLLIHGMAGDFKNWEEVIEPLARNHTVIAPDLPGHGGSAPGSGDYSLGSLASGPARPARPRSVTTRATLVGHSLGGGIAMQFSYQFPEMTERLVLVSSGGLGPEVSLVLRAAALPGADRFIATTAGGMGAVGSQIGRGMSLLGLRPERRRRRGRPRLRIAGRRGPESRLPGHPEARSSGPAANASTPATASTSPRAFRC